MGVEFYRVTANFDMYQHGDLIVKEFINLDNALREAAEQVNEFMNQIPRDGGLDQDWTDWESYGAEFQFVGCCHCHENHVTVRVEKVTFSDMEGSSNNE